MRLTSAHKFAIATIVIVVLLFLAGTLLNNAKMKREPAPKAEAAASRPVAVPSVQVVETQQGIHPYAVRVRGRTEAARTVSVRSETAGIVAATPAVEGSYVSRGTILCRLNVDAREASLAQARAAVRSRELTRQATVDLSAKGYRSQTQVLQDQANLDSARAALRQAEIAMEQTNIRAPFNGVFDRREAEVGAYLAPGQPCGTVIELDPLLIVADLPETEAGKFQIGAPATAELVSGEAINGTVRYIARDADPQTRTYRVEVTARNPKLIARSGLSAQIRVSAGQGPAHLIQVSSLVLDSAGRQGVRYVDSGGIVRFAPVNLIDESPAGAWVTGLSGAVKIITVGQSYVAEGQKVLATAAR
jgi:multidrug efflux system membrane fusion protein